MRLFHTLWQPFSCCKKMLYSKNFRIDVRNFTSIWLVWSDQHLGYWWRAGMVCAFELCCESLGILSPERATRSSESCPVKTINDAFGALLISISVLQVLSPLKEIAPLQLIKDLVELVFIDSSFIRDCRLWEWHLEENPSSQGPGEPCVCFWLFSQRFFLLALQGHCYFASWLWGELKMDVSLLWRESTRGYLQCRVQTWETVFMGRTAEACLRAWVRAGLVVRMTAVAEGQGKCTMMPLLIPSP